MVRRPGVRSRRTRAALEVRVSNFEFRIGQSQTRDARPQTQAEFRVSNGRPGTAEFRVSNFECRIGRSQTQTEFRVSDFECRMGDKRRGTRDQRRPTPDPLLYMCIICLRVSLTTLQFMHLDNVPRRRGRGAASNPANRFDTHHHIEDPAALDEAELRQVKTEVIIDSSKSALSKNNSPDIPFKYSLNPYRGCEHGCIYCYARPSHEYLGYSAGLDFETKIIIKKDIGALLAKTFQKKSWEPQPIMLSGNTDPYQPLERELRLTRSCLDVFAWYRNPVAIITKNFGLIRDIDVLAELASKNLVSVSISITSLRPEITRVMEPRTSHPERRLEAIERLAARGIPVGVMVAPLVPGLTDEELPDILKAAQERGAQWGHYIMLRLPGAVKELFIEWLGNEFPDRKQRVVNRLTDLRGESLTDKRFKVRMRGEGRWAEIVRQLHRNTCNKLGLNRSRVQLATEHFPAGRPTGPI